MAAPSLPVAGNNFDGAVLGGRPALPAEIAGLGHSDPALMAAMMRSAIAVPCEPADGAGPRLKCEVLLIISSAAGYERRRRLLRKTYLSLLRDGAGAGAPSSPLSAAQRGSIQYRFLLGAPQPEQAEALAAEQAEHGDLLQLPVVESYETIWPKIVGAFRWSVASVDFQLV
jgi:hypothetical protein